MKRERFIIIIAILTVLVFGMQTAMVSAQTLSEIREEIKQKEAELEKGKEEEKSLASQVVALETELSNLDAAIAEGEAQLVVLEEELVAAQEKVETQTTNLNSRLRNMYKSGNIGFLDVLLDSGSFSEFLTNLDLVKRIYSSDQSVLADLEAAHEEVETKKQEVETLQAELETSRTVTEEKKGVVEAKKAEIAESNEATQDMLDDLEAEAAVIAAKIQNVSSSSSTSQYTGGQMAWPAPNCPIITSPFGYRTGTYSGMHYGIDLAGSGCYGTPIVAANPGTVIISGWSNGGYGNYVVVDHGGGVVTLYAHASSLAVSVGQSVSRGQTLAYIGSTGYSTGPHLHFEVQIDGVRYDPYSYIT